MKNRYKVSEAFKQSCKENVGLKRYGRIHVVEDNIDIVGENYNGQLKDFTIEDKCYVKDTFIGVTVSKKIAVNILNPNNEIDLEGKTIQVYVGIELNGKLEEIPYGTYIIEKPKNEEVVQKTSFTGYDYMIKFNVPYIHDDTIEYPVKLSVVLEKLCDQVGLKLGSTEFTNSDYMVLGNPFTNDENCRTVLANIAQLAGGFAKIGRDNKVYICTLEKAPKGALTVKEVHNMPVKDLHTIPVNMLSSYRDKANEYIDGMNYFEDFAKNNKWGEINSLVISLSDVEGENTARTDEQSIAENGLTEIIIEDNYFLINEEEREKVIEPLWEKLKRIWYLPFKTKYYGYPHLDSGDMVAIDDINNSQYVSYVFNHTFTFNGAFSGNLDTPAMTKMQTAYKNTPNTKSKLKRVERSVDKVNGKIEDIIEFEDETTKKLSQHEQTIDEITDTVSRVEEKLENDVYTKEETKSQIKQTADSITSNVEKMQEKLENDYYTKTEADSKIEQTADGITSSVTKTVTEAKQEAIDSANSATDDKLKDYYTKTETNSQITQKADSITSEVNSKISTAKDEVLEEANSKIEQTADSINSEVRKKVGEDEIISKINQSAEEIQIDANKISLKRKRNRFNRR